MAKLLHNLLLLRHSTRYLGHFEMKTIILTLFVTLKLSCGSGFAQQTTELTGVQDSLSKLSSKIWKQKTDSARLKSNEIFLKRFKDILSNKQSNLLPLDSITGITRVVSEDGKLRIFTWNVPLSDNTDKYFGFIELFLDSTIIIPLNKADKQPDGFDTKLLSPTSWYGAIYYKIIDIQLKDKKAYTLLAWDGYSASSNRKLIDMLSFDNKENVTFGLPIFKTAQGVKSRVVMEYAEKASMLLRYDKQAIRVQKGRRVKKVVTWLIVMDRMIPMDPSMKGVRAYYVPAGDAYDGFVFQNGFWAFVEDVDVANRTKKTK